MANTRINKYLTFMLANEGYGIDIQRVKEINEMMAITPIPETPGYMKGVINLRGKVVPVIDLRERFGVRAATGAEVRNCIVVCEFDADGQKHSTGLIVDGVSEVCEIKPENIEEKPALGTQVHSEYILGIAKVGGQMKILLNIEKVLSAEEFAKISASTKA